MKTNFDMKNKEKSQTKLPQFFRPLLWSYDFFRMGPAKNEKTIITQAINYGDLNHWRWLIKTYSKQKIKTVLEQISVTELRPRAHRLAQVIFGLRRFNDTPRGVRSQK